MPISFEEAQEEARREIALTEAWTPLKPIEGQQIFCYHPARFKWTPAPRRTGKTTLVARFASGVEPLIKRESPAKICIGAPTYSRVKDIYFDLVRSLIPKHWIKRIKESTQEIEFKFHWGAVIRLLGMNKPQAVEGIPWDKFYGDEIADYPKKCFDTHIRPALATPQRPGSAWFVGVPDEVGKNQREYEHYWEVGLRWPERKEHCSFWWAPTDIHDASELEEMAEGYDPILYEQEMGGKFVRSGGRAFPHFSSLNIDKHYADYCGWLPIGHALDPGSRNAASLLIQHYKDQIWVLDEIDMVSGSTDAAGEQFLMRCQEHGYDLRQGIEVFGDAAGRGPGQQTGETDYQILQKMYSAYRTKFRNLIVNPYIKDTVNTLRSKIYDWRGRVTLYIHPRCVNLIEQIKEAPWPDKLTIYHHLAALRYAVYELYAEPENNRGVTAVGRAGLTQNQRVSARYTG